MWRGQPVSHTEHVWCKDGTKKKSDIGHFISWLSVHHTHNKNRLLYGGSGLQFYNQTK